jgi:hypothetical protein
VPPSGFGQPYEGAGKELLCTIFRSVTQAQSTFILPVSISNLDPPSRP